MAAALIAAVNAPVTGENQATSRSVNKPAGAQIVVAWMCSWTGVGGGTLTPSGGSGSWITRSDTTSGTNRTTCFIKYVDADATGTTYTFMFGGGSTWCALSAHFFDSVDDALALASVPFNTASASGTGYATTTVTTVDGAALSWSGNTSGYSGTAPTHTPPTSFTELYDTPLATSAYRISPGDGSQSAAGAAASVSVDDKIAALVALAPEGVAQVDVTIDHGLILGHAVEVGSSFDVSVDHGLVLGQSVVVAQSGDTVVDHGIVLGHAAEIDSTSSMQISHGIVLGHDVQLDTTADVQVVHGLVLGHDVAVEANVPTVQIQHGLVLGHVAAVSNQIDTTITHGLVLGHAVGVGVAVANEVQVEHGFVFGHVVQIDVEIQTAPTRPLQPLAGGRPARPLANQRPRQPAATTRPVRPSIDERPLQLTAPARTIQPVGG